MATTLSDRDRRILEAVVEEYVQTAEPVGSRHLVRKYELQVSPATVRNAMADLEEMGYLVQPHTSAGRKPTDRGYRYFVDHLMGAERLTAADRRRLRRQLADRGTGDIEGLLGSASRALTSAARQVAVVAAPRFESRVFRHVDFVLLRRGLVLVILVSRAGVVHHRPVEAPEIESQAELDRMANYLNSLLEDLPLREIKERIRTEMRNEKALYDGLLHRALSFGDLVFGDPGEGGEVFYGDPVALLDHPEFSDLSKMRVIFEAFQEKGIILTLLNRASGATGIQVAIGEELDLPTLQDCSVVVTSYRRGEQDLGSLGIIGPTRMDYPRVIGLVEYTARLLGEMLEAM